MKILILNWRDNNHPLAGGAEISLLEHAKFWQKKGAMITWFSSNHSNAKKTEIKDGITYIHKGSHYTVHLWAIYFYLRGKLGKPDIVIDNFHFFPFFTPLYMRKVKKIAFIHEVAKNVWFHNAFFPIALMGYFLERYFFLFYKKVIFICVSESTKQNLISFNIPYQNIVVIHNGVTSITKNSKKETNLTIMFLGRISKDKGIKDVLKAFSVISEQIPKSKLWIVGKEQTSNILENTMQNIKLDSKAMKNIKYFGVVREELKFILLNKAWLLVHPSKREGWGLTVIEAATQGTPTVGYNVEGLRDSIVDNKTGILVEHNSDKLADEILTLINDKKRYNQMCKNAISWSRQFSWEKSAQESWEVISK